LAERRAPVAVGEGLRRDADEPPEGPGKVALVGKAETHGHPGDGEVSLPENGGGALDTGVPDVSHGALAGADPELPSEVEPAHPCQRRQLLEGNALAEVGLDVRHNPPKYVVGQTAMEPGWIIGEHGTDPVV